MKLVVRGVFIAAIVPLGWFAAAQNNLLSDSNQHGPIIEVSASALNFGLVGVGRTKDLSLKAKNAGEGILTGTVTAAAPFSVDPSSYSLGSGKSQLFKVRYKPTAEQTNSQLLVFSGATMSAVAVTGYARKPPAAPTGLKARPVFADEEQADFIFQYYSTNTSYVLKPSMREMPVMGSRGWVDFPTPLSCAEVLRVAAAQPRRELAVSVLVFYPGGEVVEEPVKQYWDRELKALSYQRVVFLRGGNKSKQANGLIILQSPQVLVLPAAK
jgi:hypothetical protein